MAQTTIRPATEADLPGIKAVYDHHVLHSTATFETVPPPLSSWEERLARTGPGDHVLVAADPAEGVLGYATGTPYRPRPAYHRTRETSVYLTPGATGRGLGRRLYDDLLARLVADRVHTAVAVVALPNPASEALHRGCGYSPAGRLPEVGWKFDRWIDTALWARLLR